jgi:DNA-binding NarL/FixJ family response regulator
MTDNLRIAIVDDHPLLRAGVARTLSEQPAFEVVGEGASADDAVRLAEELLPDVMIIDVSMPGGGIAAARRISASCPVVKLIMLTVSEDDEDVCAALQAGARGYVLKGVGAGELVEVIRSVARGEAYVSPALAARLLADGRRGDRAGDGAADLVAGLTAREEQILRCVARGLSNKEVGRELDLQEKTVKHYMTNILQKLQVRNRVEAALVARDAIQRPDDGRVGGPTKV